MISNRNQFGKSLVFFKLIHEHSDEGKSSYFAPNSTGFCRCRTRHMNEWTAIRVKRRITARPGTGIKVGRENERWVYRKVNAFFH